MPADKGTPGRVRSDANLRRGVTIAPLGNTRTLKHGAFSRKAIGPFARIWAEEFFSHVRETSELLENEEFHAYVATASGVFARLEQVGRWIELRQTDIGSADVMRAVETESKLRAEAKKTLQSLRLAPMPLSEELALQQYFDNLEERLAVAERVAAGEIIDAEEVSDGSAAH